MRRQLLRRVAKFDRVFCASVRPFCASVQPVPFWMSSSRLRFRHSKEPWSVPAHDRQQYTVSRRRRVSSCLVVQRVRALLKPDPRRERARERVFQRVKRSVRVAGLTPGHRMVLLSQAAPSLGSPRSTTRGDSRCKRTPRRQSQNHKPALHRPRQHRTHLSSRPLTRHR